jgi:hypothetical protein
METNELIAKIEALKVYAEEMQAKHDTKLALLRPKWLENLPVAQFVELCDTFPHDPVSANVYPSTWLMAGATQLSISCERIDLAKPAAVDFVEVLREMGKTTSAAA